LHALRESRDAFVIVPTGHGKSLIHQLYACANIGVGLCVVPTLGIMDDQLRFLNKSGISAVSLRSDWRLRQDDVFKPSVKILYTTPEWLFSNSKDDGSMSMDQEKKNFLHQVHDRRKINIVTFDEAHLLCDWSTFFFFQSPLT